MKYSISWFCLCLCLLPSTAWGTFHVLDWTISGVSHYLHSPLEVQLGDTLILTCVLDSYSNIIYQPDEIQYEECNSHSGGGVGRVQGNCQGSKVHNVTIEITTSAGNLAALADYTPGSVVHYTSYSDGSTFTSALTDTTSGGECLQNLKLMVQISSPVTTGLPTTATTTATTAPQAQTTEYTFGPDETLPVVTEGLSGDGSLRCSCSMVLTLSVLCTILLLLFS